MAQIAVSVSWASCLRVLIWLIVGADVFWKLSHEPKHSVVLRFLRVKLLYGGFSVLAPAPLKNLRFGLTRFLDQA